jgi:Zn-finger nucleic acid-binding protein
MLNERCGETIFHGCERCGGVFLDPTAVTHAENVNDEDLVNTARRIVGAVLRGRPDLSLQVSCPVCQQPMRRSPILGGSRVDVCDAHGTWFDRGELGELVQAHMEARAGEISEEDLKAAGVSGGTSKSSFFGDLFATLGVLLR